MKKTICILSALCLLAALAGCGGKSEEARQGSGLVSQSSTVDQVLAAGAEKEEQPAAASAALKAETPAEASSAARAEAPAEPETQAAVPEGAEVEIDLTELSSTMVYSQVLDMMTEPETYRGKTVRMRGQAASTYYDVTDRTYHAVIIADATACCAQGIEYELGAGERYPEDGSETTVTGVFGTYEEFERTYYYLKDANLEG